jgi:PAS domain S-box-containing protein
MNYLDSIFNSIDEGLMILTPAGELLYFNGEVEHLTKKIGLNIKLSQNVFNTFPSDIATRLQDSFQEVIKTRDKLQVMTERKAEDGTALFLEINYIPTIEDERITHINILIRDISVNKIFERKITDMATELRNLIDQANAVIVGLDTSGYITEWNAHTKMITGFSKNEAFTQKFSELLLADPDKKEFNEMLERVLGGLPVLNLELPVLSKEKEKLIFLLNATSRLNANGQVTGVIFVGQDVTMRRKIEHELKFAHERLLFHLENAPLGFIEWDGNLNLKSWTRRAEEIFGWTQKEFIESDRTGYSQVYSEDLPWVSKIADDLLAGRIERNQVQHRNIRKDGTVIWCEWFNSVLKDEQGKVITLMSLVQNITERKKNELRLKEAQAMARLGSWEMDLKTHQVTWSEETFRILGYAPETSEPSLNAYLHVVHPDDVARVKSIISFSAKTFSPQSFYHRIILQEIELTLFITAKYELDALNHPIRLYGTMMDVSELTEKERQLRQAVEDLEEYKKSLEMKVEERTRDLMQALKKEKDVVEMKSRFVSIASHEFRTPLSSIQHNTNFIRKNKRWAADDELTDKLKDIEKQSKHMMFLLDDVLTYGKSEAGKIQLIVSSIKLNEFLEKIIEDVGHTSKGTHTIRLQQTGNMIEIDTDEKLLRNVLINLLTNAIKYSPGKDRVSLKASASKHTVQFIVSDSGMGIPPEEQERIFDAFVRGRSAESIQGTGLGLSIVKKAVELLGGTIELESEVGKGTTVTVTIPTLAK